MGMRIFLDFPFVHDTPLIEHNTVSNKPSP
jgi:hypothetical protein